MTHRPDNVPMPSECQTAKAAEEALYVYRQVGCPPWLEQRFIERIKYLKTLQLIGGLENDSGQ